ncbi:MAG: bifunctional 4-hydroxy-2-oxoglutarate aldolase/2-dehydro-3-deoxy-phosphogluconate aldolase [Candidatus Eisenbacteria bacterium]|nr:bifunctional 4-hydroxy-2-oxoglutarate aldolase/2-dehydro-3-deoxy-phosphogluconate aldolase [Candidatus Eisenbacteria bacterium]
MTPVHAAVFATLTEHRLVSVIRAARPEWAYEAAKAVIRGGIQLVEITYSVPDAPAVMAKLRGENATIGAGTVLTPTEAHAALEAGARFLIAPNLSPAVAAVALESGVLYCPGSYTTTEIVAAREQGAHVVKVYPVGVAGGPDYIRIIRDPLPHIPYLAAGGTNLGNVGPFLDAGCVGVGLGASLADPALAAAGRFDEIEARARAFVALIGKRRAGATA